MDQHKEQMGLLIEMGEIKFDRNDYEKAIETLAKGLNNLSTLHLNWVNLLNFFHKIESVIDVNVKKNTQEINKRSLAISSGDMKATDFVMKKIRVTTESVSEIYFYLA